MKSCKQCRVEKAEEHFRKKGTRSSSTCKACEAAAETVRAPVVDTGPMLEVPAGYGFRIRTEDGRLYIEQDGVVGDETRTDVIILQRHEALQMLHWVSTYAGEAPRP